jgi:SAM-dependent methyltransferase
MVNRETLETYEVYHQLYDAETTNFWDKFPMMLVEKFFATLPGREVLDLGSGPGRDALILKKHGLNVTCLDGSVNMAKHTENLGFKTIVSDVRELSLEKESFDGIWAYASLIHITQYEAKKLVLDLYRNIRKDGILFLGLIEGDGNETVNLAGSNYVRYFEYYNDRKIADVVSKDNFDLIYEERFKPKNHTYLNYIFKKK